VQKIDFRGFDIKEYWSPRDVAWVEDVALRLARVKGEYRWHVHDGEDEFFLVVEGCAFIDTEEGATRLEEWEGCLVKAGTRHRSRSPDGATILMIEPVRTNTRGEK